VLPILAGVAPEISTTQLVVAGDSNTTTSVLGTTADYPLVRNFELWQGSPLTDLSVENELRIAVIGSTTADDLGLGSNSIGAEIKIGGLPFMVAGILQEKGGTGFQDPDDQVLIPVTTLQKYFSGSDVVRTIAVSAASAADVEAAQAAITELLREQHGLTTTEEDDFRILDQAQLLETVSAVSDTLTLMLAGIASISLIVGGIGIMNIMLATVLERTREIGIRRAIGARQKDIVRQFLIEAVMISILGGLMGIATGFLGSTIIAALADMPTVVTFLSIAVAFGVSVGVGLLFGIYPATQAAKLDPIEAIRHE
jgi:putative ABC transport system permease protein